MAKKTGKDRPLSIQVVKGELQICVGIDTLAFANAQWQWHNMNISYKITDPKAFARDLMRAMQREEEDGSTPLAEFLDAMDLAAVEDGSEAVDYIDPPLTQMCVSCYGDQKGCKECGGFGLITEAAYEALGEVE